MYKKILSLLGMILLFSGIKANASDMVIATKLYPSVCQFNIYASSDTVRPVSTYWYKLITIENDSQRILLERINNFKILENSDDFRAIEQITEEISDLEYELDYVNIHDFDKQKLLAQKEEQLLSHCLRLMNR